MSAAALSAHRQPPEPYSAPARRPRRRRDDAPHNLAPACRGTEYRTRTMRIRGRSRHRLPCEP